MIFYYSTEASRLLYLFFTIYVVHPLIYVAHPPVCIAHPLQSAFLVHF